MSKNIYISVTITNDDEIQYLNNKHLGRDYPTDVLSFKINEKIDDSTVYLGDIVVNQQQAGRQSKKYGNNKKREIAELVEHGVLHLMGIHHKHDDETEVHGVQVKKVTKKEETKK